MKQKNLDVLVRVSTEEQTEGTSPEDQEKRCRSKAEALGYGVHRVLYEPGVSGRRYQSREELMVAIRDVEEGRAGGIIAFKLDRIGRSAEVIHRVASRIQRAGGVLLTCEGIEFSDTAMGRLMLGLLASLAEFERDLIVERTHGQKLNRARQGKQMSRSQVRYGYGVVTNAMATATGQDAGTYFIDGPKAETVKRMYTMYAHGQSARQIISWLKDSGIPSPRGAEAWSVKTVVSILTDPIYIGNAFYNRTEFKRSEKDNGEYGIAMRVRPEDEWIAVPAPPIIEAETYHRVQKLMGTARSERSGHKKHSYLLTGMIRCPSCGTRMHGKTQSHRGGERYYACNREADCLPKNFRADPLEFAVIQAIREAADDPAQLDREIEERRKRRRAAIDTGPAREELDAKLREIEENEKAVAVAEIEAIRQGRNTDAYQDIMAGYHKEKNELLVKLSRLPSVQQEACDLAVHHEILADFREAFAPADADMTIPEQRELVAMLIDHVVPSTVKGDPPRIVWAAEVE